MDSPIGKNSGPASQPASKTRYSVKITCPIRASIVKKEPMTATQIVNKLALKCCGIFSAYSE